MGGVPHTKPLVEIKSLVVRFDSVAVLRGIDLTVDRGESLGLVGESGCGKSVTWLAALGLLGSRAEIDGAVHLDGENILGAPPARLDKVRGGRLAMIFQDPTSALNPVHTIGHHVAEALRLHRGMDARGARAETRRLLDWVGIPGAARRMEAYPHELSGGQNQRVMIAVALAGQPDLLIADEPTTALDVTIQAQILDLLQQVQRETGMALVLISHDLGVIAETCDRISVMYAGRIVEEASTEALFDAALHPYSRGLLGALPRTEGPRQRLTSIPGMVADPSALPAGCSFAPRCSERVAACNAAEPALTAAMRCGAAHRAACVHVVGSAA